MDGSPGLTGAQRCRCSHFPSLGGHFRLYLKMPCGGGRAGWGVEGREQRKRLQNWLASHRPAASRRQLAGSSGPSRGTRPLFPAFRTVGTQGYVCGDPGHSDVVMSSDTKAERASQVDFKSTLITRVHDVVDKSIHLGQQT